MDIKVVHRQSNDSLNFSFGLRAGSRTTKPVLAGKDLIFIEDLSGFHVGNSVYVGTEPCGADEVHERFGATLAKDLLADRDLYKTFTIIEINERESSLKVQPPLDRNIPMFAPVINRINDCEGISMCEGKTELAQAVTKILLTNKGTDYFFKDYGSDIYNILTTNSDEASTRIKLRNMILEIEAYVIANQRATRPEERLKELNIVDMFYSDTLKRWQVEIDLISEAETKENFTL